MGWSVGILSLILLGLILQRSECVVLEAWTSSTTPQPSTTPNLLSDLDDQIVSYVIRSVNQADDSTLQEEVKASPEQGSSTSESSTMDTAATKSNEKNLNNTENSTKESPRGLIIDLGAIRNIRAKRDTDGEEPSSSEDSDEVIQDDTCDTSDQQEAVAEDSPVQGDSSSTEIEDDTVNTESDEDSGDRVGDEESLESSEQRQGRMDQSWYRQPTTKRRDWQSSESKPKREFINIPIFPGK